MKVLILVCVFSWPSVNLWGQEVVLKNGDRVAWKRLDDEGQTIRIHLGDGHTRMVKKSEIASITTAGQVKVAPVLTGATVTFKKRVKKLDLLRAINPKRDAFIGTWKIAGGALTGEAGLFDNARIKLNVPVPDEYDLHLTVERLKGQEGFAVGLIGGKRQFLYAFDIRNRLSGIWMQDGKGADRSREAVVGTVFEPRKPHNLLFQVRKTGFLVQLDGKEFYSWSSDWKRLSVSDNDVVPAKDRLWLWLHAAEFRIRQMILVVPVN